MDGGVRHRGLYCLGTRHTLKGVNFKKKFCSVRKLEAKHYMRAGLKRWIIPFGPWMTTINWVRIKDVQTQTTLVNNLNYTVLLIEEYLHTTEPEINIYFRAYTHSVG